MPPAAAPSSAPAPAPRAQIQTAAPPPAASGRTATSFGALQAPQPLRYSLIKLDANGSYAPVDSESAVREGDSVRLNVQSSAPGYLNLYVQDPAGAWQPLFPANGQGIKVSANATYTVPDSPIGVKEDEKLRLILTSEPLVAAEDKALALSKAGKAGNAKTVELEPHRATRGTPVVVDIMLGSKKE
jgi:hypothetical protein